MSTQTLKIKRDRAEKTLSSLLKDLCQCDPESFSQKNLKWRQNKFSCRAFGTLYSHLICSVFPHSITSHLLPAHAAVDQRFWTAKLHPLQFPWLTVVLWGIFSPAYTLARHLKKLCGCSSAPVFPGSDLLTMPRLGGGTATMKWTDHTLTHFVGLDRQSQLEMRLKRNRRN